MPVILPIASYIEIGYITLYLSQNDAAKQIALRGVAFDPNQSNLLAVVTPSVEWAYQQNPNDPTLNATGLYLLALCGQYVNEAIRIANNQSMAKPILTGPTNQTVNVGATATFSVSVTGTGPFTYVWYLNGVAIPNTNSPSYLKTNAQLSDSGGIYTVAVTNAAGTTTSSQAVLTVTTAITGFFTYSASTDFYLTIFAGSDPFSYGTNFTITHNSPVVIPLPVGMPANQYMLAKIPIGESIKTIWNNTALNNGTIPDAQFQSIVQFGGYTYYCSRNQISMDVSQPLTLS